jgi:hypothetical protein
VPGCSGVVLGVCGGVLGVEVCEPAVDPLCWPELEPEGDVLSGCVWAATQIVESSNNENNVAFDFMANLLPPSSMRCRSSGTVGVNHRAGNPVEPLGRIADFPYSKIARSVEKLRAREAGLLSLAWPPTSAQLRTVEAGSNGL